MRIVLVWSVRFLTTRLLMLRMMSVTSSTTPGMVVISCCTPWILTRVTARLQVESRMPQAVADGDAKAAFERLA
jgi:hypothetical protein